jgi:hypothetical protein
MSGQAVLHHAHTASPEPWCRMPAPLRRLTSTSLGGGLAAGPDRGAERSWMMHTKAIGWASPSVILHATMLSATTKSPRWP